jgi:hypothetical protein
VRAFIEMSSVSKKFCKEQRGGWRTDRTTSRTHVAKD